MSIMFTCENCGKRFKVDERSHGNRGRCSVCHHVMRIPGSAAMERVHVQAPAPAAEPAADLPFKLSPPEPHPMAHHVAVPVFDGPVLALIDSYYHPKYFTKWGIRRVGALIWFHLYRNCRYHARQILDRGLCTSQCYCGGGAPDQRSAAVRWNRCVLANLLLTGQ